MFTRARDTSGAVDELMEQCRKKGHRNVKRGDSSYSSGFVYAVGLRI